jgi:phospholipase/carboxylesterase
MTRARAYWSRSRRGSLGAQWSGRTTVERRRRQCEPVRPRVAPARTRSRLDDRLARSTRGPRGGRGASADDILSLAEAFTDPEIAYFAPQAAGHSWYPHSFLAPLAHNEPWLSSALQVITGMVRDLERDGIPSSRIVLFGFSQGGCLALEFAARNAGRYGAVIGLSAGLIGPDGTPRTYAGSLQGTPVFLGCSDVDPHIPLARVHESSRALSDLGGTVEERIYPGMGHTINEDEIKRVRSLLTQHVSARQA